MSGLHLSRHIDIALPGGFFDPLAFPHKAVPVALSAFSDGHEFLLWCTQTITEPATGWPIRNSIALSRLQESFKSVRGIADAFSQLLILRADSIGPPLS